MQNISEKNCSLQVAHEQRKFEISHMLPYIQYYTSLDEHGPIITVPTNVTFVWKKKLQYYNEIRFTLSTTGPKLYKNVDTKPSKPRNHQPNKTTFNANPLITVTKNAALYLRQCLKF